MVFSICFWQSRLICIVDVFADSVRRECCVGLIGFLFVLLQILYGGLITAEATEISSLHLVVAFSMDVYTQMAIILLQDCSYPVEVAYNQYLGRGRGRKAKEV